MQPWFIADNSYATIGNREAQYSTAPVTIDPANEGTGYLTVPLSALSQTQACLNLTAGSCSGQTDTTPATQISIGFNARITLNTENVSVTITGLGITSYAVTPGPTVMHGQTVVRDMIWNNGSAGTPTPGNGLGSTENYGVNTPFVDGEWSASGTTGPQWNLSAISPSWGHFGWINDTSATSNYDVAVEQSPSDLSASNTTITLSSSTNTLTQYQATFNSSYGLPKLPVEQGFVSYLSFLLHDHLAAAPGSQYDSVRYNVATNGVYGAASLDDASAYSAESQGRYLTMGSGSITGGGHVILPQANGIGGNPSSPYQLYITETLTLTESQFCGDFPSAASCQPPCTSTCGNGTGGILTNTLTVTGEWVLAGIIIVAGVVALAFWGGDKEGKEGGRSTMRRTKRGVGRSISRSTEGDIHDGAGIAWMVLAAILTVATFYGLETYGVLGFALTQISAATLSVVFLAFVVIMVVIWEATKEPAKN